MGEIIPLDSSVYPTIFLTQTILGERAGFREMSLRAGLHQFSPDPPIILGHMPEIYHGGYRFFVYHGHHRLSIAEVCEVLLNGLVVASEDEIPTRERVGLSLEEMLRIGLYNRLHFGYGEHYEMEVLIREMERQEALGLINNARLIPETKGLLDLNF